MIEEISSDANPKFKSWMKLHNSQGLKSQNSCLLMGPKLVAEYMKNSSAQILSEIITGGMKPVTTDTRKIFRLKKSLFNELDLVGTHSNILVVPQNQVGVFDPESKPQGVEVILPLGDPNNLGAVLRSCAAFGVKRVVLTAEAAHPFHPKTIKSSAGSVFHLDIFRGPSLADLKPDFWLLDQHGKNFTEIQWPKNLRLLVGQEGPGSKNLQALGRAAIPMAPGLESLNATVATSILLQWLFSGPV